MIDLLDGVHLVTQFPLILTLINSIPDSLAKRMAPALASVIEYNNVRTMLVGQSLRADFQQQEVRSQVRSVLNNREKFMMDEKHDTLLSTLLRSNLPPEELSAIRLGSEAVSIIGGGTETTMRALSVACFHILDNPSVKRRLKAELVEAIPDVANPPLWTTLERLPFFNACIQECASSLSHPLLFALLDKRPLSPLPRPAS